MIAMIGAGFCMALGWFVAIWVIRYGAQFVQEVRDELEDRENGERGRTV